MTWPPAFPRSLAGRAVPRRSTSRRRSSRSPGTPGDSSCPRCRTAPPRVAPLGWTPYRPLNDRSASGHILSLRHPTAAVEDVQAALADEHRIITSSRVGGIRVSLHVYNSEDDVRALSEALESIGRETS